MESLFVDDEISRFSISEALGLTPDAVTKAVYDLCRTSLVTRAASNSGEREYFRLNDQVRELLRFNPKRIEVREKVEKYLRSRRAQAPKTIEKEDLYSKYRWDVIDSHLPEDLKVIVNKVNSATNKTKAANAKLPDVYRQLMHTELDFSGISAYWRTRARVLWELQDRSEGFKCLHRALELDNEDVVSKKILAEWLIEDQRSGEALPYLEELLSVGADNPELFGEDFSSHVIGSYLYAQIFLKKFDEVATATNKWIEREDQIGWVRATARIRCFLRWAEDASSDLSEKRLIHALSVFDSAAQHFGFTHALVNLGSELIEETCKRLLLTKYTEEFARNGVEFIGKYHQDLVRQDQQVYRHLERALPVIKEILTRWNISKISNDDATLSDVKLNYQNQGYVIARIVIPLSFYERASTSFVFATDDNGEDYFVHISSFKKDSSCGWNDLKQNSIVALKRESQSEGSAKWKSTETRFISR